MPSNFGGNNLDPFKMKNDNVQKNDNQQPEKTNLDKKDKATKEENNSKNSEYCAPLTAFDWNETDRNTIVTSSIDTTCTIWDIEKGVAKTPFEESIKKLFQAN